MQFADLPDEILRPVLRWAVGVRKDVLRENIHWGFNYNIDVLHEFKRNLPLLAVCQRWRHMALPMVHSTATIMDGPCQEPVDSGPFRAAYGGSVIESNVGPIASAGCIQAVKRVTMEVRFSGNPSTILGNVLKFMRSAASKWGGVKSLVIRFCPYGDPDDEHFAGRPTDADVEATCNAVIAVFPGVSGLCFSAEHFNLDAGVDKICGLLVGLYAGQLERLEADQPADSLHNVVLGKLKRLNLGYRCSLDGRLPRMDPNVLETLNLGSWPLPQAWTALGLDTSSREIRLPRLRKLAFVQLQDAGESMWRLHLPRLERLDVRTSHNSCPLFERAVLPPCMTAIKITAGPAVLCAVARVALPAVQRLEIDIAFGADGDPTALPAACRILSSTHASEQAKLVISDKRAAVVVEDIIRAPLTHLVVGGSIAAETAMDLIQGLPSLVSLELQGDSLDYHFAGILALEPDDSCLVAPLNTSIRCLTLNPSWRMQSPDSIIQAAKELIVRMPTLQRLRASPALVPALEGLAATFSRWHAHLARIRIEECRS